MSSIVNMCDLPVVQDVLRQAEYKIKKLTNIDVKLVTDSKFLVYADFEGNSKVVVAICSYFGVTFEQVKSAIRDAPVKDARHAIMYILHKHLKLTLKMAALYVGLKDHTSVLHALKKVRDWRDTNDSAYGAITLAIEILKDETDKNKVNPATDGGA